MLAVLALIVAQDATPALQDALKAAIHRQTDCIAREVEARVGPQVTTLSAEERRDIARATGDACYDNDVAIAKMTRPDPGRSLEDVKVDMVSTTLRIADAMITVRVKANARKASGDGPAEATAQ
jgi:hypothetical protein